MLRAAAALERGILLSAPALALVALFALAALSNLQTAASGLLSGGYLLLTLGLLGRHSGLLRSEGRRWRMLHMYAWLVLLLQLLYQAPLVPLAPPYSCAASVAKNESTPLSWCTLLMSTLGLFKVRVIGEQCSKDGSGGDSNTCGTSSTVVVHDLLSWLIVDMIACLFLHPSFRAHVDAWTAARSALRARTVAAALLLAARRREMNAWRLSVWRHLRHLELESIMVRLKAIQLKLGHATPQALWRDAAPDGAPGGDSGGAGEQSERGGSEEEERPSALAHAARRLVAVGFARGDAEMSLRACGAAGSTHDALGTAVLLRALTLLIELQLGLVPRARVVHMASTATKAAAAAAATAAAVAVVSAGDAEAPSEAAVAAGSGDNATDEVRGRGKGKGKGKPSAALARAPDGDGAKEAWYWRAASDGAAWTRRRLLLLREPAVVLASLSLSREAATAAARLEGAGSGASHGGGESSDSVRGGGCDAGVEGLLVSLAAAAGAADSAVTSSAEVVEEAVAAATAANTAEAAQAAEVEGGGEWEDGGESSLCGLAVQVARAYSLQLVWLAMLANHVINANLLSLPYALSLFLYGLLESPRPGARFFSLLLGYTLLLLLLKFVYQLPVVCGSPPLAFRSAAVDTPNSEACYDPSAAVPTAEFMATLPTRIDYQLGLHKYMQHSSLPHDEGLLAGLMPDLLVFLALLLHREVGGLAASASASASTASASAGPASWPLRHAKSLSLLSATAAFVLAGTLSGSFLSATLAALGVAAIVLALAHLHGAWRAEAARAAGTADVARAVGARGRALATAALAEVRGFAARLLPPPRHAKGGTDLYMASFSVCLLILVFMVAFFAPLARTATNGNQPPAAFGQLESDGSSQISGSTVLALFVAVCVMVVDRVVYRLWEPPTCIDAALPLSPAAAAVAAAAAAAAVPGDEGGEGGGEVDIRGVEGDVSGDNGDGSTAPEEGGAVAARYPNLAPALKLTLHVLLTVALHWQYGLRMPLWSCDLASCPNINSPDCCSASVPLLIFYLLCCAYLTLSAGQLRLGMPLIIREHPLTDSGDLLNVYLFKGYMVLPFLWELRTALDWTVEQTSLDLFRTLKLEDIYFGLCSVRDDMNARRKYVRGRRQPKLDKLLFGALMVVLLLVILLGPLWLFSSASILSQPNPVVSASAALGVVIVPGGSGGAAGDATISGGAFPLGTISRFELQTLPLDSPLLTQPFALFQCLNSPEQATCGGEDAATTAAAAAEAAGDTCKGVCGYSYLLGEIDGHDYQLLRLKADTDLQWQINLPALEALRASTSPNSTAAVSLHLSLTLERQLPVAGSRTMTYPPASEATSGPELDAVQRAAVHAATLPGGAAVQINVSAAFPKFLRLPSVGSTPRPRALLGVGDAWHTLQNLTLLRATSAAPGGAGEPQSRWWEMHQADVDASPFMTSLADGLQVVLVSDPIAGGAAGSSLLAGGVLVFYFGVVYAIGRTIRSVLGGTRYRLMVDEMPDPRDLLDLCEGVYIARREKRLLQETELTEIIFRLFRSSETLLQLTGTELKRHGE